MSKFINVEPTLYTFNKTFESVSNSLYEENLDEDIFIRIFKRVIQENRYLYDNEIIQIFAIKNEDAISLTLDFYKNFDYAIFKKLERILLQLEKGISLSIYDVHTLTKRDFQKVNEFGLPKYTTHGRNYSSAGYCCIYIPTRLELKNNEQNSVLKKGYCTIYDVYTLVHELAHCLDTDLTLPCLSIDSFTSNEIYYLINYTRGIFREVSTSFIESIFTTYLLKNSIIPKSYITYHVISKYNDRIYRTNLFFFILIMNKIFKKNKKITIDDIANFIETYGCNDDIMDDFITSIIEKEDILSHIMPYAIDHVFSPILIKEFIENRKSGIIKFKKYTNSVIDDKLYDIFKIYSINFKRKNYIDLIIENYKWYYEYVNSLIT